MSLSSTIITNSIFTNNSGSSASSIFRLSGILSVTSCTFNQNLQAAFFSVPNYLYTATITSSVFQNNVAAPNGDISFIGTKLNIMSTTFTNITPGVLRLESGNLIVGSTSFIACGNSINALVNLKTTTASFSAASFIGNSGLVSAISVLADVNSLSIQNSYFINNVATVFSSGGTIVVRGVLATVNILNCTFTNNLCYENSAVIYLSNATTQLQNSIFTNNKGAGAISVITQVAIIDSCVFSNDNAPDDDGVGIYLTSATVKISNTNITNNTAQFGGAIYMDSGVLSLENCIIANNTAQLAGSLYVRDPTSIVTIRDCQFINNFSTNDNDLNIEYCGGVQTVTNTVSTCSDCECALFQCDCRYSCCASTKINNLRIDIYLMKK
jgi:hypothetical protein